MVVLTLTVVVFAMAQAAVASPAGGKLQDDFDLAPRKFQALKMTCVGQEDTTVSVKAAEGAQVQLQVFDAEGNEIAADFGANPSVKFTPEKTAKFRVKISNLSFKESVHLTITAE